MNIADIASIKDLREMNFSELFYGIFDAPDRIGMCDALVERICPGAYDDVRRARTLAIEFELLREHLEARECILDAYNSAASWFPAPRNREWPSNASQIRAVLDLFCSFCESGKYDMDDSDALLRVVSSKLFSDDGEDTITFFQGIREEQFRVVDESLHDRAIKGLEAIPRLDSDQELIVCLGKLFHVRMREIDAYTGLVYTSEWLDCDKSLYRSVFLSFSAAEKEKQLLQMKAGRSVLRM